MGEDGSGAGSEGSLRSLTARGVGGRPRATPSNRRRIGCTAGAAAITCAGGSFACSEVTLPRLAFPPELAADPLAAFSPNRAKLWLEVGFGAGEHALAQIDAHPEAALIACEVFDNGICSLLSRLVPEGDEATAPLPANLRLWTDDARALLRRLPDACLDRLFLMFPDPWPKARHAKRRFVHPALLPLLGRV